MKTARTLPLLTAVAALALTAGAARAVTVAFGDLVLGVRANSGQGAGLDLMVNIGPASNYYSPSSSSFIVPGLSSTDLTTTYGSNWKTRSDLQWGVVGTTGAAAVGAAPARTLWASRTESSPGTSSIPWLRGSVFTLQIPSNTIGTLYTGAPGSLGNSSATPNSAVASLIDDTLAGSWTVQDDFTPGVSFRYFNPTVTGSMSQIPGSPALYDGLNGYGVLDLFEVRPGTPGDPASLLGAFGINALGQVVFSTSPGVFAPVPEPAPVLTSTLVLAVLLRRRR